MKGALIGFGTIGNGHFQAYEKIRELTIIAVVDITEKRLQKAKELNKNLRVYKKINELFSREKIDFIDICTPPNTHLEFIRAGLSNGCHVLCEKPFLCFTKEYKGLLPLVKKSKKVLYPSHNYKFSPVLQEIYNQAKSKNFGKIVRGHFRTLRQGHAVGVPEWNPHWRRQQSIAKGGILRDHGTHSIYLASHIVNDLPRTVSCMIGNFRNDQYKENEDTALLNLYFPGDTQFLIDLSWAASFRNSYYSVTGSKQTIIVENDEIKYLRNGMVKKKILFSDFDDPSHKMWFVRLLRDFLSLTKSPERQLPLLKEALMTTLVIEKAYESAKLGGVKIKVPQSFIEFLI